MKYFILVILLTVRLPSFAQDKSAFFSSDSAGIINIANKIAENTVNKYQFEKSFSQKTNVEFWYRGNDHRLLRILFKLFPDRSAVLAHVDGKFEDVFPFWKKYFQFNADQKAIESAHKAAEVTTSFLNGTAIFSFRGLANPMWQLSAIYKVTPVQPEMQSGQEPKQKKKNN